MERTGRKLLLHDVPSWVDPDASDYFVTICCKQRGTNQLCLPGVGHAILESARFYRDHRKWFPSVFLLMPDHVHMIVSFGQVYKIEAVVSAWKRFVATKYKIVWQQGFFEHRLRQDESAGRKHNTSCKIPSVPVWWMLRRNGRSSWPWMTEFAPKILGSASERHPYL